jgi:hypothetical protein
MADGALYLHFWLSGPPPLRSCERIQVSEQHRAFWFNLVSLSVSALIISFCLESACLTTPYGLCDEL